MKQVEVLLKCKECDRSEYESLERNSGSCHSRYHRGKAGKELEVIAEVTEEQTKEMISFLEKTDISVQHVDNGITFEIVVTVSKGVLCKGSHCKLSYKYCFD